MGELESDGLVVSASFRRLELHPQLVELYREEVYRHVTVECLRVCPALHPVLVGQSFVHGEERVQLVIVYVPVLECACVNYIVYPVEYLAPVLVGDVMRDLVKECTCDLQTFCFRYNKITCGYRGSGGVPAANPGCGRRDDSRDGDSGCCSCGLFDESSSSI